VAALLLAGVVLLVAGCGGGEPGDASTTDDSAPVASTSAAEHAGRFTGTVGAQPYDVPVTCIDHAEEYFTFRSDRTDVQDTNGDGYIISGDQMGEKLILTIVDGETTWSTPNVQTWDKQMEGRSVTGSGRLYEDGGDNRTRDASFTVACESA
jgi:hypothetical protein